MRYEAKVSCFDVLDEVFVGVSLKDSQTVAEGHPVELVSVQVFLQGEGISDPREWLRDALCALIEAL